MIRLSPIELLKITALGFILIYGWHVWDSRKDALERIVYLEAQIKSQADIAKSEADRKAAAFKEAKRKADNEAKHLQGRIAWLQKQTPKGCNDAARIIHEYRTAKP